MNNKACLVLFLIVVLVVLGFNFFSHAFVKNNSVADNNPLLADESHLNLGDLLQFHEATKLVMLTNRSNHDIFIENVGYSCGCTRYSLNSYQVPSHQSAQLQIWVNAENREGPISVDVYVYWFDKTNNVKGQTNLTIKAVAKSLLTCSDSILDFGPVETNVVKLEKNLIVKRGTSKIKWDHIRAFDIQGSEMPVERLDANTFILKYQISPSKLDIGIYKDEINLQVDNGTEIIEKKIIIPVSAQINSKINIRPTCIYLGLLSTHVKKTGVLQIQTPDGSVIRLLSFKAPSFLDIKLDKSGPSYLTFSYSTNRLFPDGALSGNIFLTVLTDKSKTLKIPVLAFTK